MNAEQIIKEALDGRFFVYVCGTQQTREKRVSKDYIPSHKPVGFFEDDARPSTARPWSEAEDALLIEMFNSGYTFREMGRAIKVSQNAANVRWQQLCVKHGFKNERRDLNQKYPAELYARVAHLKSVQCMTQDQIAKELGLTLNQVQGIWRRWRRNNNMDEIAA